MSETTIIPTGDGRIQVKRTTPPPTREERYAILRAAADAEPTDYRTTWGGQRRLLTDEEAYEVLRGSAAPSDRKIAARLRARLDGTT